MLKFFLIASSSIKMLAIYQLFSKHKLFQKGDVSNASFIIRKSDACQMFVYKKIVLHYQHFYVGITYLKCNLYKKLIKVLYILDQLNHSLRVCRKQWFHRFYIILIWALDFSYIQRKHKKWGNVARGFIYPGSRHTH